jgi:hypothetical protein
LTAASAGTPFQWEGPRQPDQNWIDAHVADVVAMMTEQLDREEALKTRITTKINTLYTQKT